MRAGLSKVLTRLRKIRPGFKTGSLLCRRRNTGRVSCTRKTWRGRKWKEPQ